MDVNFPIRVLLVDDDRHTCNSVHAELLVSGLFDVVAVADNRDGVFRLEYYKSY